MSIIKAKSGELPQSKHYYTFPANSGPDVQCFFTSGRGVTKTLISGREGKENVDYWGLEVIHPERPAR